MASKSAPASRPRFDFRTAYFAVVAGVSVLVFGFSLISFLANVILLSWPGLLEADMARAAAHLGENAPPPSPFEFVPSNRDMVENGIAVLVMGIVFWFHGRHFFGAPRD